MGEIVITTRGSFSKGGTQVETAKIGGHAAAIGRAIEYLSSMLPAAIRIDHDLHNQNVHPPLAPFGNREKI